ncbi:hypothetical protein JTE90_004929, partial [Oedothorax gibbosus]
ITLDKLNGTNVEPTAPNPSNNFPVTYPFSPLDNEWWLWVIMISFACTVITVMLLCLICRKPYKTAVVRLSEDLPTHYAGTVLAPEGIIHPDVSFYTQVQPCSGATAAPSPPCSVRPDTGRLQTPCKPLQPAYQPTQLLAITTVRLPYLTTTDHLALPPGYVSMRDSK